MTRKYQVKKQITTGEHFIEHQHKVRNYLKCNFSILNSFSSVI